MNDVWEREQKLSKADKLIRSDGTLCRLVDHSWRDTNFKDRCERPNYEERKCIWCGRIERKTWVEEANP